MYILGNNLCVGEVQCILGNNLCVGEVQCIY